MYRAAERGVRSSGRFTWDCVMRRHPPWQSSTAATDTCRMTDAIGRRSLGVSGTQRHRPFASHRLPPFHASTMGAAPTSSHASPPGAAPQLVPLRTSAFALLHDFPLGPRRHTGPRPTARVLLRPPPHPLPLHMRLRSCSRPPPRRSFPSSYLTHPHSPVCLDSPSCRQCGHGQPCIPCRHHAGPTWLAARIKL